MGGAESTHTGSRLTKTQVFNQLRPLGGLASSFLRQEQVVCAFYPMSNPQSYQNLATMHQPSNLASLLLGCYEQLNNISDIVEAIIKLSIEKESKLVCELNSSFGLCLTLANARNVMLLTLQQFSPLLFTPFNEHPIKTGSSLPKFDDIIDAFKLNIESGFKNIKNSKFDKIMNHYKTATPATALPPPTPEFIPKEVGSTEAFSARAIMTHGISSNGDFLFVLCSDMIQIFPLFNMGSLIPPITRQMEFQYDKYASITADKSRIYIYCGEIVHEYQIIDLLQKKKSVVSKPIQPNYICYLSDGIITLRIENDFFVTVYENNRVIRKIKLTNGNSPLNSQLLQLFPRADYAYVPIETNGTFLSFMFRINQTTVIYRVFSLITGRHIHDDVFTSTDYYYATATDSMNRCHWVVSLFEGNKLGVRRYYFAGSIDPSSVGISNIKKTKKNSNYKKFVNDFGIMVVHYIGSQVIPKTYLVSTLEQIYEIISLIDKLLQFPKQEEAIQALVILLELNLKQYKPSSEMRDKVIELVEKLPQNLALFLFFNSLQLTLFEHKDSAVTILVDILTKLKNDTMINYALTKVESCYLIAAISFSSQNMLSNLLPSDTRPESSVAPVMQSLLLIHQRVLITVSSQYVKSDSFDEIQFQSNKKSRTPLDFLNDYVKVIVTRFQKAIDACKSHEELDQSLILFLFYNFLNLLSSISTYHVIAQFLTDSFSGLLDRISTFIDQKNVKIEGNSNITNTLRLFLFVFGKLSATLLRGTSLTDFEKRNIHIIRSNLDISQDVLADSFEGVSSKIMNFLKSNSDSNQIMDVIYKKFKPFMHKNLTQEFQNLDKLALITICKHLNCLDELFDLEFPFSPKIKSALDLMLKVRNASRSLQQSKSENYISLKCKMLLKMNTDSEIDPNEIGDFITSKETPNNIIKYIMRQNDRAKLTALGFSLVDSVLSMDKHTLFVDIFTYTLSQIENFDGLASILKITRGARIKQIKALFTRILNIVKSNPRSRLIMIAFRFFRDCEGLVIPIQNSFLEGILSLFVKQVDNYSLFALSLSLIGSVTGLPKPLSSPKQSPMGWLLQYLVFEKVPATESFFNEIRNEFWNCYPNLKRLLCRVMFKVLDSPLLSDSIVEKEIKAILNSIGKIFLEFSDIRTANEYTWILRRMLTEGGKSKKILLKIIKNVNRKDDTMILGIFAILGNMFESIRPFCNVKSHPNRTLSSEFIAVPTGDKNVFFCYERPFTLTKKPFTMKVTADNLVYAVAVITIDNSAFNDYDFILSFFNEIFNDLASIKASLYVQVLANFLQYKDFLVKITPEMIDKLAKSPLPFDNIQYTISSIRTIQNIKQLQPYGKFNQILFQSTHFISYLSPQLKENRVFNVSFSVPDRNCFPVYFGIVSDNVESYFTRYSVISFPHGVWYPYNNNLIQFKSQNGTTFSVDMTKGSFTAEGKVIDFPRGEAFRIIIAAKKNVNITINCDESNFNLQACPCICPHGAIMAGNKSKLYEIPKQLKGLMKKNSVPNDISEYTEIRSIIDPIPIGAKVKNNFLQPPDYISIHCGFATHASFSIIAENVRGLFKTIALQWSTVCLMRIAANNPNLIPNPAKLFSLLSVPLEPFSNHRFRHSHFPFTLEPIKEHRNSLYMSLENDALNAINALLSKEKIVDKLCHSLLRMSESRNLHLIAYPHIYHKYYPPRSFRATLDISSPTSIISINSFIPKRKNAVQISNNKHGSLPFVASDPNVKYQLIPEILNEDLSILSVSTTDNGFAFDTAFEILIILKNLSFVAITPKQKLTLKSVFVNLVTAQSPFVWRYFQEFSDFIELQISPSPLDYSTSYIEKLYIMSGVLKGTGTFNDFDSFITQESRVLGSEQNLELCKHFPEFMYSPLEKPKSKLCSVPIVSLDPGTIKENFAQHIRMIRLFTRQYSSLKGFPFWEILPYWLRVSGAWISSNSKSKTSEIDPYIEPISQDVMHICNPTAPKVTIHLRQLKSFRPAPSSMLMLSTTPDFENADFIPGKEMFRDIEITGQHMFLALIEFPGSWSNIRIEFPFLKRSAPLPPEKIDISQIHDAFIADMTEFVINWKLENTEELILALPSYAFSEPLFSTVESIAKTASLTHRFSTNVVVLRALLLHHFNYIRSKYQGTVSSKLWESMSSLISAEDAAEQIFKSIACGKSDSYPTFTIDRHAAKRLAIEGRGDYHKSIVTQLSVAFRHFDNTHLRCKKRPWKIKFDGELAIDAGGPTRELMTEIAVSIFEPTTQLFIPVPNNRRGEGDNKDAFIPYDPAEARAEDYATIGKYLGMVLRSGLSQDLPFAPLIWKYLAREKITTEDVYQIDSVLEEQMKQVPRLCEGNQLTWSVEHWNGSIMTLPGHAVNTPVKIQDSDKYIQEVIAFRINSIKPMMKIMRKNFNDNIGFSKHPLLTGKLLSRIAQGSSIISTEHLRAITVVSDYEGIRDPYVQRFWRIVDKFTPEQRKLLLKFITTLTRLPNPTINPDFRLQIDRMNTKNPDETLPTAATCFNRLHLPAYSTDDICAEKVIYAITYCQSMENK